MLFAQELAQRTRSSVVRSIATHPGVVLTTLFKELGPDYQAARSGSLSGKSADRLAGIPALRSIREAMPLKIVLKSPGEGCRPLLYSLLAPDLPSGGYIVDCALTDISPARQELWEWTERWVDMKLGSAVQEEQEAAARVAAMDETNAAAAEVVAVGPLLLL